METASLLKETFNKLDTNSRKYIALRVDHALCKHHRQ